VALVLTGKNVVQAQTTEIKTRVDALVARGITPKLAIVRFGQKPDDLAYERGAKRTCERTSIACETVELPEDAGQEEALQVITRLNDDKSVHGILVMQPLPKQIDATALRLSIDPAKDIDGMSPLNSARVFEGDPKGFPPCTPTAVMEMIRHYGIELKGKKVVVLGRSLVVGKPASMLLLGEHATVTICHSRTTDLAGEARQADILVAAIGRAKMVTKDFVKPGAIVIDVGINVDADGKLCGDVDYDQAAENASMITPVPGGVGSVTTIVLAKHVVRAAEAAAGD
jgi:methylenetetrahydrofolate dehydrogenase (NADP+)/methenyltetrahydrofolate cyclohydrolase